MKKNCTLISLCLILSACVSPATGEVWGGVSFELPKEMVVTEFNDQEDPFLVFADRDLTGYVGDLGGTPILTLLGETSLEQEVEELRQASEDMMEGFDETERANSQSFQIEELKFGENSVTKVSIAIATFYLIQDGGNLLELRQPLREYQDGCQIILETLKL